MTSLQAFVAQHSSQRTGLGHKGGRPPTDLLVTAKGSQKHKVCERAWVRTGGLVHVFWVGNTKRAIAKEGKAPVLSSLAIGCRSIKGGMRLSRPEHSRNYSS